MAPMMYGFGDDTPAPDTIAMMEELVIDHITDIASLFLPFPSASIRKADRRDCSAFKPAASRPTAARSKSTTSASRSATTQKNSPGSTNSCSCRKRLLAPGEDSTTRSTTMRTTKTLPRHGRTSQRELARSAVQDRMRRRRQELEAEQQVPDRRRNLHSLRTRPRLEDSPSLAPD